MYEGLAKSVAILVLGAVACLLVFGLMIWDVRGQSARVERGRRLLVAWLGFLTAVGVLVFTALELKLAPLPTLWLVVGVALLCLVVVMLTLARVLWAGIQLLGRPVRHLRRERPAKLAFRNEQELVEQTYRDLELGRKARTRGEN